MVPEDSTEGTVMLILVEEMMQHLVEYELHLSSFASFVTENYETPFASQSLFPVLLSKKNVWTWGPSQEEAYTTLKDKLSKLTTLTLYNPAANIKLSADASSYGLGAMLLQETNNEWQPVAYGSRTMTETERQYTQM